MLIIPPPTYRKSRRREARAVEPLVALTADVILNTGVELEVRLKFNTTAGNPLTFTGPTDAAKWTARYAGKRFNGMSVSFTAYDEVVVGLLYDSDESGDDQVVYLNSPSDIADAGGRQLAAFEMVL